MKNIIKRALSKARADARYHHKFNGAPGAPIIHPMTGKQVAVKDYGEKVSAAFGVYEDDGLVLIVKRVHNARFQGWLPLRSHRKTNASQPDSIWAVRLQDMEPVQIA